jgi:hypothetical protein
MSSRCEGSVFCPLNGLPPFQFCQFSSGLDPWYSALFRVVVFTPSFEHDGYPTRMRASHHIRARSRLVGCVHSSQPRLRLLIITWQSFTKQFWENSNLPHAVRNIYGLEHSALRQMITPTESIVDMLTCIPHIKRQ